VSRSRRRARFEKTCLAGPMLTTKLGRSQDDLRYAQLHCARGTLRHGQRPQLRGRRLVDWRHSVRAVLLCASLTRSPALTACNAPVAGTRLSSASRHSRPRRLKPSTSKYQSRRPKVLELRDPALTRLCPPFPQTHPRQPVRFPSREADIARGTRPHSGHPDRQP